MSEMKAFLSLGFKDRASAGVKRFSKKTDTAIKRNMKQMSKFSRQWKGLGKIAGKAANRYTALISGVGIAAVSKYLFDIEERYERLGIQANITSGQVNSLKNNIDEISQLDNVKINPSQLLFAVEKIVEKTGDLKFAKENIEGIALAIQATGAEGADIGALATELRKFDPKNPKEFVKWLDLLIKQGKSGSFAMKDMATQGERIFSTVSAGGGKGESAIRETGAVLQMIRQGVGSSEQATTAFNAIIRDLRGNAAALKKSGISIFDPEKAKQGIEEWRSLPDIIKEIVVKSKGNTQKLGKLFGDEAFKGIAPFVGEFKKTGQFETFDNYLKIVADGNTLLADSARAADTANAKITNLITSTKKASDYLMGPFKGAVNIVDSLSPESQQVAIGAGAVGGAGVIGAGALWGASAAKDIKANRMKGVLNQTKRLGRFAGKATPWLAAGTSAIGFGSAAVNGDSKGMAREGVGFLGTAGGAVLGGELGAGIGTLILPGIGTAIGAIVGAAGGSIAGSFGGESLGETIYDALADDNVKKEKAEITVKFENAPKGTRIESTSQGVNLGVDTGYAMGGL